MADFKTHIATSTVLGVGYGVAGYLFYNIPAPTCALAAGLCSVSGMLPDLDSGPGKPLRESMAFAAAIVPMLLLHVFQSYDLSPETIILCAMGTYLLIRFGLTELLKLFTVHRGMFHSIPAMLIAGELIYLIASGRGMHLRLFKGSAVCLGFFSHLVLDELWALEWHHGLLRRKSSFGTALKLFGRQWWPNTLTLVLLVFLSYSSVSQPMWVRVLRHEEREFLTGNATPTKAVRPTAAGTGDLTPSLGDRTPSLGDRTPSLSDQRGGQATQPVR